jgi:hypothetical protein
MLTLMMRTPIPLKPENLLRPLSKLSNKDSSSTPRIKETMRPSSSLVLSPQKRLPSRRRTTEEKSVRTARKRLPSLLPRRRRLSRLLNPRRLKRRRTRSQLPKRKLKLLIRPRRMLLPRPRRRPQWRKRRLRRRPRRPKHQRRLQQKMHPLRRSQQLKLMHHLCHPNWLELWSRCGDYELRNFIR